jgi:hypothetical protein
MWMKEIKVLSKEHRELNKNFQEPCKSHTEKEKQNHGARHKAHEKSRRKRRRVCDVVKTESVPCSNETGSPCRRLALDQ